jgi:hypothetical protein
MQSFFLQINEGKYPKRKKIMELYIHYIVMSSRKWDEELHN